MTKMVEFTKDMRPHTAGDTRAVPDEIADRLAKSGEAKIIPSIFENSPAKKQRYLIRKGS